VKRFSDKRRSENKRLEQKRDSKIVHFALESGYRAHRAKKFLNACRSVIPIQTYPSETGLCESLKSAANRFETRLVLFGQVCIGMTERCGYFSKAASVSLA